MTSDLDEGRLLKTWVHSHEDDREGRTVYRVSTYAFPPSRGRVAITLRPGGVVEIGYPGPDDRSRGTKGSWSLAGNLLTIEAPGWGGALEIESVDEAILVVRRIRKEISNAPQEEESQ